jgi:hypothetical protein
VKRHVEELLSLPVRVHGIELGRIVDVLVDRATPRALGFDVLCGDQAHRFLPFPLAVLNGNAVEIDSPLLLVDFGQSAFYREQASSLRDLNGDSERVVVAPDGTIEGIAPQPR